MLKNAVKYMCAALIVIAESGMAALGGCDSTIIHYDDGCVTYVINPVSKPNSFPCQNGCRT